LNEQVNPGSDLEFPELEPAGICEPADDLMEGSAFVFNLSPRTTKEIHQKSFSFH